MASGRVQVEEFNHPNSPPNPRDNDDEEELSPTAARRLSLPAFFGGIGEAIGSRLSAAGALIGDADLRRRGAQVIASNASKGLKGIQQGIQTGATTLQRGLQTVGQGPRQVQAVLQRLSAQIEEQRMKILLEEQRDAPVDVQCGFQLYEDAPQELRSRLWMVLLQHPELVERYQAIQRTEESAAREEGSELASPNGSAGVGLVCKHNAGEQGSPSLEANEAGSGDEIEKKLEMKVGGAAGERAEQAETDAAPSSPDATDTAGVERQEEDDEKSSSSSSAAAAPAAEEDASAAAGEGWEVVGDRGAQRRRQGRALLAGGSLSRSEPWTTAKKTFRQDLMAAMAALTWPLPTEVPPDCRYATLLQISVGQEETDDIISRDIHRTFPEYPLFSFEQGQQALFRVLKAYSLHDLEVGYCQGMAFVAGLMLFFVPEEAAFQILCRLLAEKGPNLRRHYLPGLHGLKVELRTFDVLLGRHLPSLKAHLEKNGAVPVLYASQWFLSSFSCPFPVGFACRLVDVMMVENSDAVLMRVALAVMAESEAELLMQENFEELLTYLKSTPMQWPTNRLRRVLNAAIFASPVTRAELAAATAVASSDEGPPLGRSTFGGGGGEENRGRAAASGGGEEGSALVAPGSDGPAAGEMPGGSGGVAERDRGLESEMAAHQEELDSTLVQMVVDLDNLWGAGGEESGGAVAAYETALAGAAGTAAAAAQVEEEKNPGDSEVP